MRKIILMFAMLASAAAARAMEPEAVLAAVDRNLAPETYESYRKLVNIEPDGGKREFTLFTVKKGHDKVASLFLAPESEKGRTTLRLGDNMWLYIPAVGKPIRITSLQSVVGGVFNNADIMRLDYGAEYAVESMEDLGATYVLRLKAKTQYVAYDRLTMTVDAKELVPVAIECHAATGLLIKTLHFKEMKAFDGGQRRPAVIETDSPLYKGYKSIMITISIKERKIPDEVFTLTFMPKLEGIR